MGAIAMEKYMGRHERGWMEKEMIMEEV